MWMALPSHLPAAWDGASATLKFLLPSGSSCCDTGLPAPCQAQLSMWGWGSLAPTSPGSAPIWLHLRAHCSACVVLRAEQLFGGEL